MEENYNKLNWEHEVFVQRFEAVSLKLEFKLQIYYK